MKILANGLEPRRNLIMNKTKRKRTRIGASSGKLIALIKFVILFTYKSYHLRE